MQDHPPLNPITTLAIRAALAVVLVAVCVACDPGEGQRFIDQEPWYRFDGQTFELTVRGARLLDTEPTVQPGFACPSGESTAVEVPVFGIEALTPTPLIEIARSRQLGDSFDCNGSTEDVFGIELSGLPIDAVDLYRRCDADAQDRLVNRCDGPVLVGGCTDGSPINSCERVVEGRYRMVAWSEYVDDPQCRQSGERTALIMDGERPRFESCATCNVFRPGPDNGLASQITVAVRADTPETSEDDETVSCCDPDVEPVLTFCARQCVCRRTFVTLEPKTRTEPELPVQRADNVLKLAVVSDVESNKPLFHTFLDQARAAGVDAIVHIGDLTDDGGQSGVRGMANYVAERNGVIDGSECAEDEEGLLCCADGERLFPQLCNARIQRPGFMNGLGRNETDEESFFTFFQRFGPTNFVAVIGNVQIVMLDSANGTMTNAQFEWLDEVLRTTDPGDISCEIAGSPPTGLDEFPLASECNDNCSCLPNISQGNQPLCVPPPAERSQPVLGGQNCMCLDGRSQPCPGNLQCGDDQRCVCSRDTDCGPFGARCADGACVPPVRLVFTHTPPFDLFGARNQAFLSRREAARLMATLSEAGVARVFAGSINTFGQASAAGVPLFVTGGGGADLEIFDETGHHWLLVTIPDAWGEPTSAQVNVEIVKL